ncbi:MAG: DUF3877 family protein [Clostridia bacterium]|nr:DUF3877 family protein [Clostridia bacterium]
MMSINFEPLHKNVLYVIKESQMKLGYTKNAVRLNYPLDSLNGFLCAQYGKEEMKKILQEFSESVKDELGKIEVSEYEGMFTLIIPEKGAEFVNRNVEESAFLAELIGLVKDSSKSASIDDILAVFRQYSDHVRCIQADNDEFDYVVWFEDGEPDDFRYCIDVGFGHATYHRLAPQDYKAYGFGS